MAWLHIDGLHCTKKRDPVGKDEIDIYVSVDGGPENFISGPYFLDKSKNDDFADLHEDHHFTEVIKVRLKERDGERGGNNDKDLGFTEFLKTELNDDGHEVFGTDGVSYSMDYRITA